MDEVSGWLSQWLASKYGKRGAQRKAIGFRPLGGETVEMQVALQAKLVRYLLKTMAPARVCDRNGQVANVLDLIGLKRRQRSSHLPIKRMTGTSQNLAYRRQVEAGFHPPEHWEDLLSENQLWRHRYLQQSAELTEQLRHIGN